MVKNLEFYCKDVTSLVIWKDCDREGEAIGFDIIDVCKRLNRNIDVYRAHFSAMTFQDISGAMQRLTPPNRNLSEAVKVRQEIDLRIGASFTSRIGSHRNLHKIPNSFIESSVRQLK